DLRANPGKLRRALFAVGQGTGNRVDDDVFGVWIFFGCGGVANANHIAGAFDERVLKSATGSEERAVVNTRELYSLEHAVKTFIRAAGRRPETVVGIEDS